MNAAAAVLFTAAILIYAAPCAYAAGLLLADRLDSRAETRRREQQKRTADVEWFALLAATDTPIFARLAAEQMRAELDAPDAVDRIAGGRA